MHSFNNLVLHTKFCNNFFRNINRKRSHAQNTLKSKWQSVVGLEIHAQIASNSKLFSGAATNFVNPVNTNVSLFDAAIPGTLPVINKRCIEAGISTALALSCKINAISMFDRKHYFYADLPAGYQITQQRLPLAVNGQLQFKVFTSGISKSPYTKTVRLKQLQLEQDSGKSLHDVDVSQSLVDLNRCGVALIELVFEPDLSDGEEAAALVKELVIILQRLDTCTCKMEEGALRVDANVSVNRIGEPLGVRSEVKNIGSIRGVASAIKYEISRQIKILESGHRVINETRAWDAQNKITIAMRDKEVVQDYRYMPEPNLPPLHLNVGLNSNNFSNLISIEEIRHKLPELPEETRENLIRDFNLTSEQAIILVNETVLLKYFKSVMKEKRDPKIIVNILINDLMTFVNKHKLNINQLPLSSLYLGELVDSLQSKMINLITARKVLEEILCGNKNSPQKIIEINNWSLINSEDEIKNLCLQVVNENPNMVDQYLGGKTKLFKAFLGKVATITEQRVDMTAVSRILKELMLEKSMNRKK